MVTETGARVVMNLQRACGGAVWFVGSQGAPPEKGPGPAVDLGSPPCSAEDLETDEKGCP